MTPLWVVHAGLVALLTSFVVLAPAGVRADPAGSLSAERPAGGAATDAAAAPPRQPAVAPVGGRVLRDFQPPATPYGRGHRGVDLAADPGEPVRATLAGRIAFAGPVGGVNWVTVAHGGGLDTTYGGLDPAVRTGDRVPVGGVLGHATGAGRVDWGARRHARYIDPLGLLGGWTIRLVPFDAEGVGG